MKSIAKNIGKLNQKVGEALGSATKHELAEDIKDLEEKTEARRKATDDILEAFETFLKTLEKKKEATDKVKHLAVETLGLAFVSYGSDLPEDSPYGQALLKVGETEQRIGEAQNEFSGHIREGYVKALEAYMADMKSYKKLKEKLESRRLDYDAKVNRLQKSKKEKPEWDEEMRVSQTKYEETLADLEKIMISLNTREEEQLRELVSFLDAQFQYHSKVIEMLTKCKTIVLDSSHKGTPLDRPNRKKISPVAFRPVSAAGQGETSNATNPFGAGAITPQRSDTQVMSRGVTQTQMQSRQVSAFETSPPPAYPSSFLAPVPVATAGPPRASRKLVRANYSFQAENKEEMTLTKGDVVSVVQEVDEGWWLGECNGRRGLFPSNYVEPLPEGATPSQGLSTSNSWVSFDSQAPAVRPAVNMAGKPSGFTPPAQRRF